MSSCAEHTLACLYAVLEPEVEIHVLGLDSDGPAKIQSAARDAVVGSTGKFPDIPHGPAESTTDIEVETVKSLRGSRSDSESTKGKQEQYPLTQYQSPVSIGRALLDYPCFFDAANWHGRQDSSSPGLQFCRAEEWGGRRSFLKNTGQ